ncbi:MAG: hypothetical protein DRJ68_06365 [Thermoprotei archaeon]|nr:MAG: hypothetical protein DRJ68_06365 [Thermoprotei archaeon]
MFRDGVKVADASFQLFKRKSKLSMSIGVTKVELLPGESKDVNITMSGLVIGYMYIVNITEGSEVSSLVVDNVDIGDRYGFMAWSSAMTIKLRVVGKMSSKVTVSVTEVETGEVKTADLTLTVKAKEPVIVTRPANVKVRPGELVTVTFTVHNLDVGYTYKIVLGGDLVGGKLMKTGTNVVEVSGVTKYTDKIVGSAPSVAGPYSITITLMNVDTGETVTSKRIDMDVKKERVRLTISAPTLKGKTDTYAIYVKKYEDVVGVGKKLEIYFTIHGSPNTEYTLVFEPLWGIISRGRIIKHFEYKVRTDERGEYHDSIIFDNTDGVRSFYERAIKTYSGKLELRMKVVSPTGAEDEAIIYIYVPPPPELGYVRAKHIRHILLARSI